MKGVAEEQIKPKGVGPEVAELVKQDIDARVALGETRYGERLRAFNGRNTLMDAYQEVLDLANYLRQLLEETKEERLLHFVCEKCTTNWGVRVPCCPKCGPNDIKS